MKKRIFIVFSLLFNIFVSIAQTYIIKFTKNDFDFIETIDGTYIIPKDDRFVYSENDISSLALPYYCINILLPENKHVNKVNFNIIHKDTIFGINKIAKSPTLIPTSYTVNEDNINRQSTSQKHITLENVSLIKEESYGKYNYAIIKLTPFIYDEEVLTLITEIGISLDLYRDDNIVKPIGEKQIFNYQSLKSILFNPGDLDKNIKDNNEEFTIRDNAIGIDYLIITTEALASSFLPLAKWKTIKGVNTKIISLEYITNNFTGNTLQLKIKQCIAYYIQNHNIQYVLLGGDDSVVPVQYCYCQNSGREDNIPCDLFYACLGGAFDWDANCNNITGEPTDSVVFIPSVHLSRLPIRTSQQATDYIQKVLRYEQQPNIDYIEKMLLCGTSLSYIIYGLSDSQRRSEMMYNEYIYPYWSGIRRRLFDTGSDFGGASYDETAQHINAQIDFGHHFVHNESHGSVQHFSTEDNNGYQIDDAFSLGNLDKLCIFNTTSCHTNAFDSENDPCLSEALIRNQEGGVITYFGSSRYGWTYLQSTLNQLSIPPSLKYNCTFYKKIFNEKFFHFAEIVTQSKLYYVSYASNYNSWRWLQLSLNPIGDSELPIYSQTPQSFSNITSERNGNALIVSTNGVNDCLFTITSIDGGETYYQRIDSSSTATFTNVPDEYYLVITKKNYIPYIEESPNCKLQNKTILSDESHIGCQSFYIGSNVMPYRLNGGVTVNNGATLSIENNGEVVIVNDFKVENGGELFIY